MDTLVCVGSLLDASFIRIYDVCNHFYGNDGTKFSKNGKIFVKPPIRRKSHTALPTHGHWCRALNESIQPA
jgi:hypothetical protein